MWTPKRILLLGMGFGLFFVLFFVYTLFLGSVDGIMPLPQEYWPGPGPDQVAFKERGENEAVQKLRIAFGPDSKEIKERSIKLSTTARGMVLATNEVNILKDGRVQIRPFSVALFGKDKGDGSFPEINTVQADEAYLTFDSPIRNQFEMSNRKIIGGELRTHITIINNRGTAQKSDDISLDIPRGPVFYDEKQQKLWTETYVTLQDFSSKPKPTIITAQGMEVYLVKETPEPRAEKAKTKGQRQNGGDAVSGVERVILQSNVDMHLWVDARTSFLGSSEKKKEPPDRPAPAAKPAVEPEKAQIVITTQGPFVYHVQKDLALFDSPPVQDPARTETGHADSKKSKNPLAQKAKIDGLDQVCVIREHAEGDARWYDHIVCDHLELQFRPKPRAAGPGADRPVTTADKTNDREIETAHATSRSGNRVVLVLDQEGIEANGNELEYHAGKGKKGAKTVLRGAPLEAINKEGHKITATEMVLISANADNEGQQMEATGPGEIYLFDKTKNEKEENQYPCHARWKDKLVVTKDKIGGRVYDLLTLNTDAAFLDDEHKQQLVGQRLQVWLEPGGRAEAAPAKADPQSSGLLSRQRPYKVEAEGQVRVNSPELRIANCQNLIVIFIDVIASLPDVLPGTSPGGPNTQITLKPPPPSGTLTKDPVVQQPIGRVLELPAAQPESQGLPANSAPDGKSKETPRPLDLSAKTVRATVRRSATKSELQTVYSEGNVVVHQEGSTPKDKGVHITGETLQLDRDVTGDKLQVFAGKKLAELQLGELYLIGPKVVIDQRDNTANIEGAGAMSMPSNTAMEGGKPAKEGARMTVTWTRQMFFNGREADFQGKVVAYQVEEGVKDKATLQCNTLQVTLDKNVSFKEGQKAGQSAKVEKMVCDQQVIATSITFDPQGKKMLQYHRMENREMTIDNQQGPITASGPGRVSILQYGAPDELGPAAPAVPGKQAVAGTKQTEVLKLTRVRFENRMWSEQKNNARTTKFFGNVRVLNLPTNDVEVRINQDQLPKNSFIMSSEYLEVLSRPAEDKGKGQFMKAHISVKFRTPEFYGMADVLIYNEAQETVIFEGTVGNPARVWQFRPQGAEPKLIQANRILYFRRTGQFQIDRGNLIKS